MSLNRLALATLGVAGLIWTATVAGQGQSQLPVQGPPPAAGQEQGMSVELRVRGLLESGLSYQRAASGTNAADVATANLNKAIARYREATELDPDSYSGHFYWGASLILLANRTPDPTQAGLLLYEARGRFALAARHPDAGGEIFEQYGYLLLSRWLNYQRTPATRRAVLDEADRMLREGIKRAQFTGDKARLQNQLGLCQVMYAVGSTDPAYQQAHYKEAVDLFTAATAVKSMEQNAQSYGSWGVALLKLGQMTHDKLLLRSAAERFQSALDKDPTQTEYRYNLACAYALLNEADPALRHLRQCLENDPKGQLRATARQDPDLENLRWTEEYKKLLGTSESTESPSGPHISN